MSMKALSTRLAALERQLPRPQSHRVIRLVCNDGDEAAAHALAKAKGFDEAGDTYIIRRIVPAPGQSCAPREPRVIAKSGVWGPTS